MNPTLAIIADDLTGALDSAAPFAGRGLRAVVALGPDGLEAALASGAAVVAVNTTTAAVAESITGWTLEEATAGGGRELAEVFRIVNESTRAPVESPVVSVSK